MNKITTGKNELKKINKINFYLISIMIITAIIKGI